MDRVFAGGEGCTLLAKELLVGATTLLLKARTFVALELGVENPSDVSGRAGLFFAVSFLSSLNPDILRIAETGVMFLIADVGGTTSGSSPCCVERLGCGTADVLVYDVLRSRRSGLRRWKPKLVSGLTGMVSTGKGPVRGLCGGEATDPLLTERAFGSKTPDRRRPRDALVGAAAEVDAATEVVLAEADARTRVGLEGSVSARAKKSVAVSKLGRSESSAAEVEVDVGGCSLQGEVRASKKRLSSSTGVKAGRTLDKLDRVPKRPFASNGRPEGGTGALLARLSRSAAALLAEFEIKVAEPRDACFLCPNLLGVRLCFDTTLSSDCETGSGLGSGRTRVLYTASGESASRSKSVSSAAASSFAP